MNKQRVAAAAAALDITAKSLTGNLMNRKETSKKANKINIEADNLTDRQRNRSESKRKIDKDIKQRRKIIVNFTNLNVS